MKFSNFEDSRQTTHQNYSNNPYYWKSNQMRTKKEILSLIQAEIMIIKKRGKKTRKKEWNNFLLSFLFISYVSLYFNYIFFIIKTIKAELLIHFYTFILPPFWVWMLRSKWMMRFKMKVTNKCRKCRMRGETYENYWQGKKFFLTSMFWMD